jgi:hypothetical protein
MRRQGWSVYNRVTGESGIVVLLCWVIGVLKKSINRDDTIKRSKIITFSLQDIANSPYYC